MSRTVIGIAGILWVAVATTLAGGWAVITVTTVPDHVVVGQPVIVTFGVRGHGTALAGGLQTSVEARSGSQRMTSAATPTRSDGYYTTTLTLPQRGEWTITIDAGAGYATTEFRVRAVDAGEPVELVPAAERGARLFSAKGCVACHVEEAFRSQERRSSQVGPPLTGKTYRPEWLRQQLANPPAPGARRSTASWGMPNLQLRDEEITALVAFINRERGLTARVDD